MEIYTGQDKKIKYKEYCSSQCDVPVFIHSWWLDLEIGPTNWDVILVQSNNSIIAAFPFCFSKLKFFNGIGMPPIAPYQGFHISYPPDQQKQASKVAWEEKAIALLLEHLPVRSFLYLHLFPSIENWIPFHWKGYKQTTKYSFTLHDIGDLETVFSGFEKRARNVIRKAGDMVSIKKESSSQHLIDLTKATYQKQGKSAPYDFLRFKELTENAINKGVGKIYTAFGKDGIPHSSAFVVWNNGTAFYIIQSSNPAFNKSGSASLLVWHAIQEASKEGIKNFDFTGSMMPNIAKYIRSFGATPMPRHYVWKEDNNLLRILMMAKEFFEK